MYVLYATTIVVYESVEKKESINLNDGLLFKLQIFMSGDCFN